MTSRAMEARSNSVGHSAAENWIDSIHERNEVIYNRIAAENKLRQFFGVAAVVDVFRVEAWMNHLQSLLSVLIRIQISISCVEIQFKIAA
ncbi:DUF2066 domain-containing protein [Sesbania bispinosa]|nr:DUF2066 domain-containing protein [Sesbania bispinosa]